MEARASRQAGALWTNGMEWMRVATPLGRPEGNITLDPSGSGLQWDVKRASPVLAVAMRTAAPT